MDKLFLLADDDQDDAELFKEALADVNASILFQHAENGYEVFRFLNDPANKRPDLIFLDLNMPQMSGWQCLARLKNDTSLKSIPVVMYTTSSIKRDSEIAMNLGAHGLISKPSNYNVLKRILESLIENLNGDLKDAIRDIHNL